MQINPSEVTKILKEQIKKFGDKVEVKNGYGRNFLLKKGKALRFNKENLDYVTKKKDELKHLSDKFKEFWILSKGII